MKALHVPAAGETPVLGEVPVPTPDAGQVLVRVKAAALNAIDNAIAGGMLAGMLPHEYPVVLGRDAAGVVEAVGPGVEGISVGDEVFGHVLLAPPIQAGTLAEYALLPAAGVALKPAGIDFVTAAAIPLAGAAASAAVAAVNPAAGQTVLVNGASGGVGSYAVQLLAAQGLHVVATGTSEDVDRLKALGAEHVIDYTKGEVVDQVLALHPDGVDALVNHAGNTNDDVPIGAVRSGGAVSTTTMAPDADAARAAGLAHSQVMAAPTSDVTGPLAQKASTGDLSIDVQTALPLEQAADGLATLAAGAARGKIVITIGE